MRATNSFGQKGPSSVKPARNVPQATRVLLAVAAGGRCEFAGCNQFLFEDPLTLKDGNFSEAAHIVAFSESGPRGRAGRRPRDVHDLSNLMLLCQPCHKRIDDHPADFPRQVLTRYKADHEERIRLVTGLGPEMKTTVVQMKALIGGQAVDIPASQIYDAVAPRYPTDRRGWVIDLTTIAVDDADFMRMAAQTIDAQVDKLYAPGMDVEKTQHISLFALGPIPLLVHLGWKLSNKMTVDLFQRHRGSGPAWKWRTTGLPADYESRELQRGFESNRVALVLSLSGPVHRSDLPASIDASYTVYEIGHRNSAPAVGFLRRREDLEVFREVYRDFLAAMMQRHPGVTELHLFPAVPAPVAIALGHDLLPKVHPALVVYDADKAKGGFNPRTRINDHDA